MDNSKWAFAPDTPDWPIDAQGEKEKAVLLTSTFDSTADADMLISLLAAYRIPCFKYFDYEGGAVTALKMAGKEAEGKAPEGLALTVFRELDEYFQGRRKTFDFPCRTQGTAFQEKVWAALREIPYGETRSYRDIAEAIGHPKAYRAVGMANNANPLFIIIPCHRVIGADGSLTGYGGGLPMKKALLMLEKKHSIS